MTTMTCLRGSDLGRDYWIDMIQSWFGDFPLSDDDEECCFLDLFGIVNDGLAGSLSWYPWTSEVHGDVDDPAAASFTHEDFRTLADSSFQEVVARWDSIADVQRAPSN